MYGDWLKATKEDDRCECEASGSDTSTAGRDVDVQWRSRIVDSSELKHVVDFSWGVNMESEGHTTSFLGMDRVRARRSREVDKEQ